MCCLNGDWNKLVGGGFVQFMYVDCSLEKGLKSYNTHGGNMGVMVCNFWYSVKLYLSN